MWPGPRSVGSLLTNIAWGPSTARTSTPVSVRPPLPRQLDGVMAAVEEGPLCDLSSSHTVSVRSFRSDPFTSGSDDAFSSCALYPENRGTDPSRSTHLKSL